MCVLLGNESEKAFATKCPDKKSKNLISAQDAYLIIAVLMLSPKSPKICKNDVTGE